MTDATFYTAYDDMPAPTIRLRRGRRQRQGLGGISGLWLLALGATALSAVPAFGPGISRIPALASRQLPSLKLAGALPVPRHVTDDPLLLPGFVAGTPSGFGESRPVPARFVFADAPTLTSVAEAAAPTVSRAEVAAASEVAVPGPQVLAANGDDANADAALPSIPPSASPLLATNVPLPTPRPTDIAPTVDHAPPFRPSRRPTVLASVTPDAKPMVSSDNRSFLEKFFGMGQQDGKPATYALRLREALFHGVEALRLTPVGSSVFGRVGLLAHTYMLGPKGDSNGCVSFRDYRSFLQAFKSGNVRRLVVVARLS